MYRWRALIVAMVLGGWACTKEREAPPVVAPPVPVLEVAPEPPAAVDDAPVIPVVPDTVAGFPDLPDEPNLNGDGLLTLLVADPHLAERALGELPSPSGFHVALIAQFATIRGEKSFDVDPEPLLPTVGELSDAGVLTADAGAWIRSDVQPLLPAKGAPLAQLPLNTRVEVISIDGERARVRVALATSVVFDAQGTAPERVASKQVEGWVPVASLADAPLEVEALVRTAKAQSDDDDGKLKAIALWQRAWRIERSGWTREGLLRAGWAAQRASTVVRAALARDFMPVRGLKYAWSCVTPPPDVRWQTWPKVLPKTVMTKACLARPEGLEGCENDPPKVLAKRKMLTEWLTAHEVTSKPWLRFTVDAREPRQVFLVATPLEVVDPCTEFQEVRLLSGSGQVRRLAVPLGGKDLEIWAPIEATHGMEWSILSTSAEGHAVAWLRAREHYRWTYGPGHELQVSLGIGAHAYEVPPDVEVSSYVQPAARSCTCETEAE